MTRFIPFFAFLFFSVCFFSCSQKEKSPEAFATEALMALKNNNPDFDPQLIHTDVWEAWEEEEKSGLLDPIQNITCSSVKELECDCLLYGEEKVKVSLEKINKGLMLRSIRFEFTHGTIIRHFHDLLQRNQFSKARELCTAEGQNNLDALAQMKSLGVQEPDSIIRQKEIVALQCQDENENRKSCACETKSGETIQYTVVRIQNEWKVDYQKLDTPQNPDDLDLETPEIDQEKFIPEPRKI
jgi:hypothetical protein